jgi:glycosyltransferase involved in cell wall biosynthesis
MERIAAARARGDMSLPKHETAPREFGGGENYATTRAMLSVIVATHNSERALVPTLAALVPGATAGLVREVIVADAESQDATAEVADIAGCRLIASSASLGQRLAQAAEAARGPWLLFMTAGAVPQSGWIEELSQFIDEMTRRGGADAVGAVFRAVFPAMATASPLREAMRRFAQRIRLRRRETIGLVIAKRTYLRLVREDVEAPEPENELVRRLGRRRIVTLQSGAVLGSGRSPLMHKAGDADDDQIDRDDEVEKTRHDENENAGDQRHDRRNIGHSDDHEGRLLKDGTAAQ